MFYVSEELMNEANKFAVQRRLHLNITIGGETMCGKGRSRPVETVPQEWEDNGGNAVYNLGVYKYYYTESSKDEAERVLREFIEGKEIGVCNGWVRKKP